MIRILDGFPPQVLGIEAVGRVSDDDYEKVLIPALEKKRAVHEKLRLVYVLGNDFESWTIGAVWEEAGLRLKNPNVWEKIAFVCDNDWVEHTVKALRWMVPGDVRVFEADNFADAEKWVQS